MARPAPLSTKLKVYHIVVQSVLLYASETWVLDGKLAEELRCFHFQHLRHILNRLPVEQPDGSIRHPPNSDLLRDARASDILDVWRARRLTFAGKVLRLQETKMTRAALTIQDPPGIGRSWRAHVLQDLKAANLSEEDAANAMTWRDRVRALRLRSRKDTPEDLDPGKTGVTESPQLKPSSSTTVDRV